MSKNTISFHTLGCRLNQSETAVVERTFANSGYTVVDFNEPADVVVINTCTVTENGDADTRRLVNKVNRLNPDARIALIGCQAQIQKEQLTALPNVRWVVGNAEKLNFRSILEKDGAPDTPQVITPAIPKTSFTIPAAGIDRRHTRANIKIQDGCDFFCSFCEIPYARGRARSRSFGDILGEARALVAAGHKELVITGINVGTYQNKGNGIIQVVDALEQVPGLERIRISSIEPTTIPPALISKMAERAKLCRHLHIPLQSASNAVLKSMKRKYSLEEFRDFILMAYGSVPEICLGTDVIVGYPEESDEDFRKTADYLKKYPMDYIHVFSYSRRRLAKSQKLPQTVSSRAMARRSRILRTLSAFKRNLFYQTLIGSRQRVLFEQNKNGYWTGLSDNYARIKVKSEQKLANQLHNVHLVTIDDDGIAGELE